ncbi:MAG: glycosyltransferase [Gammaproteobacteria bacterium]
MATVPARVLWVTYDFPPRQAAGAFRPIKLYKYLDHHKYRIEFLTSPAESYAAGERLLDGIEPAPIVHRARGLPADRFLEPLERLLARLGLGSGASARGPLWKRAGYRLALSSVFPDKHAIWGCMAALRAYALHRRRPFDAIYTTSHPESAHLPGLLLRRLGVPWIADYRYGGPLWTTNLHARRPTLWNPRRYLAWQRRVLEGADIVVTQSETLRRDFSTAFDLDDTRILTVPNGYDEDDFAGFDGLAAPFTRRPGELHLVHVGGDWFADQSNVAALCTLLRDLKAEVGGNDVVLHALGVDILPGAGVERGFRYVYHGPKPHAQVFPFLAHADAFLLSTMARTGDDRSITGFLPSKLWEYLRAGKPILWMGPQDDAWRNAQECGAVVYLGQLGAPVAITAADVLSAIRAGVPGKDRAFTHQWDRRAALFTGALDRALHRGTGLTRDGTSNRDWQT